MIFNRRVTSKVQFRHYWPLICLIISFIILFWWTYLNWFQDNALIPLLICGLGIVSQLPLIPLHLNYYKTNNGDELIYDSENQKIIFKNANQQVVFYPNEIVSVKKYMAYSRKVKTFPMFLCDYYQHEVITINNGTQIIITSFLDYGLSLIPVDEKKISYKIAPFRWVKGPSLQLPK